MDINKIKIKSKEDLDELQKHLAENRDSRHQGLTKLVNDYIELSGYLSTLLILFKSPADSDDYDLILEEMTFRFYTHYSSIFRLGSLKTEIYDYQLILDEQAIGAIVRIMIEIVIVMRFIYGTRNSDNQLSRFRFNVWKYCDLIYNQNSIRRQNPFLKRSTANETFDDLLSTLESSPAYAALAPARRKAISQGNWPRFQGNLLNLAKELRFSELFTYSYSILSAHIHSSYHSLTEAMRFSGSELRFQNYKFHLGIAGLAAKELFVLLYEIENPLVMATNQSHNSELIDKIHSWIEEKQDILRLENELR